MGKKPSRNGPTALKKSVVISEVVEKDYLKELEIGGNENKQFLFICLKKTCIFKIVQTQLFFS